MLIIFTLVIHTKTPAHQAEVVLQDVILPEYSGFEKSNLKVRPRRIAMLVHCAEGFA
jgi:hypothetical protein